MVISLTVKENRECLIDGGSPFRQALNEGLLSECRCRNGDNTLWRGDLFPIGGAAVVKPVNSVCLMLRVLRFRGRYATHRG
ncbi:hypothetical protein CKQ80_11615 [Pseudomonas moraviensis]|uniref:Uncharacterized protein n=1 Tax=Pseudomonas moraviensis TaxID=321662 RepID=A0A2A2PJS6_9PSED|nr:hypothetical protein CKQ80_11615 [Pseudomonas moraviensis]PAW59415.1 hypothetical protein CKQ68_01360 [Pseudomonas moraviensis]